MSIQREEIETILTYGVMAPSGENCQPWKFIINDSTVSIILLPKADQSIYNTNQKGSYIAHGALIENIVLYAQHVGILAEVLLFPADDKNHVADILLSKNEYLQKNPLSTYISDRCTNRKEYSGKKLTEQEKKQLQQSCSEQYELRLIDEESSLNDLGNALAVNEQVLFENKQIHDFFYDHILWDKKDEEKAGGFFIDTLEFLPRQLGAVKLFKSWKLLSFLNSFVKVSKKIAKENGEKYARSGTVGVLSVDSTTPEAYVNLGRSVERMWLTATKLGLAVHPCNGTIYFFDAIESGNDSFSDEHIKLIKEAYSKMTTIFFQETTTKRLAFMFRIGHAALPTARAKRMVPCITYIETIST